MPKKDTYGFITQCAHEFNRLISYQHHIIIGRKGKTLEFTVSFDRSDFHHLAGLHKLQDNIRFQTRKRSDIMKEILLDSNEIIFRYNAKANIYSAIQANFLLQNDFEGTPIYLFLAQRSDNDTQVCRTFSPKSARDSLKGNHVIHYSRKKSETSLPMNP